MKIRTKIILTLSFVTVSAVILLLIQSFMEKRKNEMYIKGLVQEKQFIFNTALLLKQKDIQKFVNDYSIWDEMVNFNQKPDSTWANEVFSTFTMNNFEVNAIYILDSSANLQFSRFSDINKNIRLPISKELLLKEAKKEKSYHFYVQQENNLIEFFGQKTYKTGDTEKTNPYGFYFVARIWDSGFIEMLENLSDSKVEIEFSFGTSKYINKKNYNQIEKTEVHNFDKKHVANVLVSKSFKNLSDIYNISKTTNYILLFGSVFFILVLIFLLIRWIFIPLQRISNSMIHENPLYIKNVQNKNDEFGQIAKLFLEFLNHKEELLTVNDQLIENKNKLEHWNREITDSIYYARRIQKAILPESSTLNTLFSEHFVFYEPKEIVSGDFYWVKIVKERLIIAVADCTGHGVPGAFMSLLGINSLNEIVQKNPNLSSGNILDELRIKIKTALNQNLRGENAHDGLDIALCVLDLEQNKIEFSGAYHPLYHIRNKELTIYSGDKMPIGIHKLEKPFSVQEIQLEHGDSIYMYSDGYVDQYGGEFNRKFMTNRFKNLLLNIQNKTMDEQKDCISSEFMKWKGHQIQVDDVIVLGLKF